MTYPSDNPLAEPVDLLRHRHFRPLIVPTEPNEESPVSQGLVRHGIDELGRPVVDVLVLRVDGPSAVLRSLTIDDKRSPLAISGPIQIYEELHPLDAVERLLDLTGGFGGYLPR